MATTIYLDQAGFGPFTSIASATTTDLSTVVSNGASITGTTTITSFGTGANLLRIIKFVGILTLTHNATSLILPNNGSNITTAAGDRCIAMSDASGNWTVISYQRADGAANSNATFYSNVNGLGFGINVSGQEVVGIGRNSYVGGLNLFADAAGNSQAVVQTTGFVLDSGVPIFWSGGNTAQPAATGIKQAVAKVISVEGSSSTGGTIRFIATSPSQITGNQNNYAPGGTSYFQRWNTDASRNITGLSLSQVDGQGHLITNVGSADIVLVNQSVSSTDVNRFLNSTGADITLTANQSADIIYDNTTQRWRVFKRN